MGGRKGLLLARIGAGDCGGRMEMRDGGVRAIVLVRWVSCQRKLVCGIVTWESPSDQFRMARLWRILRGPVEEFIAVCACEWGRVGKRD